MKQAAVGCLLVVMAWQAHAAGPIYRCGSEYSQVPCPGGTVLESSDPRSAEQRAEAKRIAADDRRRVIALERERRAQEKSIKPALAGGITARPRAPPLNWSSGRYRTLPLLSASSRTLLERPKTFSIVCR